MARCIGVDTNQETSSDEAWCVMMEGMRSSSSSLSLLSSRLSSRVRVLDLTLWKNRFIQDRGQMIGEAMRRYGRCKEIKGLIAPCQGISSESIVDIIEGILDGMVDVLEMNLMSNAIKTLPPSLESLTTLTQLNLWGNQLDGSCGEPLAALLRAPDCRLQTLDISNNKLGVVGSTVLADGLRHNETLKSLKMSGNGILNGGAMAIANALAVSSQADAGCRLTHLDLAFNRIGVAGARALYAMLKKRRSLVHMNIGVNRIIEEICIAPAIKDQCRQNTLFATKIAFCMVMHKTELDRHSLFDKAIVKQIFASLGGVSDRKTTSLLSALQTTGKSSAMNRRRKRKNDVHGGRMNTTTVRKRTANGRRLIGPSAPSRCGNSNR